MSNELKILGAAYGKADVTGKVRSLSLRKDQQLSVIAHNDVFGDTWPGKDKSLVVVYKYGDNEAELKVVKEDQTLEITNRHPLSHNATMSVSRKEESLKLKILGAAYGLSNVTVAAQRKVGTNQEFNQPATNAIWGDGWKGHKKTLVVVYEYSGISMIEIAVEDKTMYFIASPPLTILGAAYGLNNVTVKAKKLVKNRSLKIKADNATFGDGWRGTTKTLVVVYQYGKEVPSVAVVKEGREMQVFYSRKQEHHGPTDPRNLVILGAAYGPADVTTKVRSLVKSVFSLDVKVSNDVFGDTWRGEKKSFVTVCRYGGNVHQMFIVPEKSSISVSLF